MTSTDKPTADDAAAAADTAADTESTDEATTAPSADLGTGDDAGTAAPSGDIVADADEAKPEPHSEMVAALLHERATLKKQKLDSRVKEVDAQLKHYGYEPTRNTAANAPQTNRKG